MHKASLDQLVAFVAVAEAPGFSAAAKRLGLTTNAVSARIQTLERALDVRLFTRTTRSVALTNEGERYYTHVAAALAGLATAEEEIERGGHQLSGTIRIAVPGVMATSVFLKCLRDLLDEHPRLHVQIRVTSAVLNLAAEGLDIVLHVDRPADSTFIARFLGRPKWVLVAEPAYLDRYGRPRQPNDLAHHRCLKFLSHPAQDTWVLVDSRGRKTTAPVGGSFEADDSRTLGDAAYAGLGIGVRSISECESAAGEGRLERVLPDYWFQPREIYALVAKGRTRVPRIVACIEALRAAVRALD